MQTSNLFRKTLPAAALVALLAASPLAQVAAQDAGATQKPTSNQTVPDKAADGWITTKVKSELATTKGIKSGDLSVNTTDGVVTITGTAATSGEKAKIEAIAKKVKGVKSVDTGGVTVSDNAK
ncbi:hyperosmotically inducible protein [Dyella sp. SG562]|uniref:BON domain-containing protein n=1 Tax=Dyella TaxID=231454 RepID=UPI00142259A0|nr:MULTISPECIES: BON domain-containing protein [unclassified Dyella]NII71690.1 hyperosmotically inducible protein [Dyella sp. SG562]NKJ21552.1 hyperosmotically inducible protein [Dyella sp. SG609]